MPINEAFLTEIAGVGLNLLLRKYDHSDREYIGEFTITDRSYIAWEIKVRTQRKRGRYLKIARITGEKLKLRASADNYKINDEYLSITLEEWIAFAEYSQTRDSRLVPCLEEVLKRLAANSHLID